MNAYKHIAVPRSAVSKYGALLDVALRVSDVLVIALSGWLAYRLRFGGWAVPMDYQREIGRSVIFGIILFSAANPYRSWRGRGLLAELATLTATWTALGVVYLLYTVAMKFTADLSRLWLGTWYLSGIALLLVSRGGMRAAAYAARRRGVDTRTAVIVGQGSHVRKIEETLAQFNWTGIVVLGHFTDPEAEGAGLSSPRLGSRDEAAAFLNEHRVDQVWLALPLSAQDEIQSFLHEMRHHTAEIKFVPDLFGMQVLNNTVEDFAGMPVVNLRGSPFDGTAHVVKAIEDRALAFLILVLISPLLVAISVAVKLSSPGPILFRQKRHGRNGKVIEVWKFRSMRVHDEHGKVTQATKGDPRVTRVGAFLRRTSLDELPQFFNVMQGTMSIVGPRPHAIEHNDYYKELVQDYMQRHRVKPGITGWAQVNGLRGETDTVDKMAARVEYDLYYLKNWSLWLDLRIIFMTALVSMRSSNAY